MSFRLGSITENFMTFLTALVPVFKSCPPCAVCMPKYAAIFAFFGLELSDYSEYLLPAMLLFMIISLSSMLYRIINKKLSYYPFMLAIASCLLMLVFRYVLDSNVAVYITMASLLASIMWHNKMLTAVSCCAIKKKV